MAARQSDNALAARVEDRGTVVSTGLAGMAVGADGDRLGKGKLEMICKERDS